MYRRRSIERGVNDRNSPPPNVVSEPGFHQRIRKVAERVIKEMREDVREHYQSTGEAYLPHPDAAQPTRYRRHVSDIGFADINDWQCLDRHAKSLSPLV
jgi:hypothetical protein